MILRRGYYIEYKWSGVVEVQLTQVTKGFRLSRDVGTVIVQSI